jgi:hypothetical protein
MAGLDPGPPYFAASTLKLRLTSVAVAYTSLPACAALMVQVPAVSSKAFVREIVQTFGVVEV